MYLGVPKQIIQSIIFDNNIVLYTIKHYFSTGNLKGKM